MQADLMTEGVWAYLFFEYLNNVQEIYTALSEWRMAGHNLAYIVALQPQSNGPFYFCIRTVL